MERSSQNINLGLEQFKIQAYSFQRETNMTDFEFAMITQAHNLDTLYDGFLGIQPYQGYMEKEDANFMYQLQKSGKITH
jgi:hypothetical protein